MSPPTDLADGYVRRLYVAGAKRAGRSVMRALGGVLIATGVVVVALVGLGWLAQL